MNYNLQVAKRKTRLVDCGPCNEDEFVKRVDDCCRYLALNKSKLQYSPGGKLLYFHGNVGRMVDKLKFVDYLKRHAEIEKVEMKCPVFIVGFPRTGTTLLHELLNAHPDVQEPRCWEQIALTPTIDNESLPALEADRKKRYDANKAEFTFAFNWLASDRIKSIHRIEYDLPEECTILCGHEMPWFITDFPLMVFAAKEFLPLGASTTYIQYRKMLQLLTWQAAARRDKVFTWVLKSPFHLPYLDELLHAFPNSPIIWTHRNPAEAIPSACSLFENCLLFVMEEWSIDRHLLGKAVMEYSLLALERALKFIDENVRHINVLHVRYVDLVQNPKEICRKILKQVRRLQLSCFVFV